MLKALKWIGVAALYVCLFVGLLGALAILAVQSLVRHREPEAPRGKPIKPHAVSSPRKALTDA
jgi:hypothetical protein